MQKQWSSYRITLLLYFIVLLLPFSFYFIYTSFQTMQQDTTIVRQSSWIPGAMEHLPTNAQRQQIEVIDKSFEQIALWTQQNNSSDLYIGRTTLVKDLKETTDCWTALKEQGNVQCYDISNDLAVVIEKMVYLKQKKIINIFYMSLAIGMILILFTIYLVRTYIHIQMKKHAIHDHETKLFNKKYCLAELKTSCARAQRYGYPLSIVSISIANIDAYDKKTKQKMLNTFGELMHATTRISDIACRYDKNHFIILLPDPEENSTIQCQERIGNIFEKYDFNITPKPEFKFSTTYYKTDESEEKFMERTLNQLK